jgi:ABC-type Fe3+/spermidine/putrescine transport system ATPase subunit
MLELSGVCARAGTFRLDDISLSVAAGESHVLLGPSGAGKSTLLEVIIGLRPLAAGQVEFSGRDLAGVPAERRGMGYLPQRLALFPHLTVRENIVYGPRSRHLPAAEYRPVVDALVEATGIGGLLDRRPDTLSGGERQRVALVRALAARPPLLLLDEPFSALNESLRHELWRLLISLRAEYDFAVLMITHDLSEGFFLGDRITLLIDGKIQKSGDKDDLWRHPTTLAVAEFLGVRNIFTGTVAAVETEAVLVDCPSLGGRLRVPPLPGGPQPVTGATVSVGIRAEFVALRDADHPPKPGEFVLGGQITTVSTVGTDVTLLFRPDNQGQTLEINVGRRLLRTLDIAVGQTATIGLPPQDLLLLTS